MKDGNHPYDGIIGLDHHVSSKHPRMPMEQRAAQFSPFAALNGHADAIDEARRHALDTGPDAPVDQSEFDCC